MRVVAVVALCLGLSGGTAAANECPGNPDALGTSRVLTLGTAGHVRIGTMQYPNTLPLAEKEVVLTFDDGPLPPYTESILETLAAECVKANYFIVGRMARAHPGLVRRIRAEGHIVGTHTENHLRYLDRVARSTMESEVDEGIASVGAALGDPKAVAPFFRIPGLRRSAGIEAYLGQRGLAVWSADLPIDDWRHIGPTEIISRTLTRLEAKGRGIILLHDIQPATALALPELLRELKSRGYRVVQVVPTTPERPALVAKAEPVEPAAEPDNVAASGKGRPAPMKPAVPPAAPLGLRASISPDEKMLPVRPAIKRRAY